MRFKLLGGPLIIKNVLPHLFDCQRGVKRAATSAVRSALKKATCRTKTSSTAIIFRSRQ